MAKRTANRATKFATKFATMAAPNISALRRFDFGRYKIAVLVPCYNEEAAIHQVVVDFKAALPEATVYVYDNNSTDKTIAVAKAAGAVVRTEKMRGKGNVVRRM